MGCPHCLPPGRVDVALWGTLRQGQAMLTPLCPCEDRPSSRVLRNPPGETEGRPAL